MLAIAFIYLWNTFSPRQLDLQDLFAARAPEMCCQGPRGLAAFCLHTSEGTGLFQPSSAGCAREQQQQLHKTPF